MPPHSQILRLAAVVAACIVSFAGCSRSTGKKPAPQCPDGTWMIVGDQLRTLLGAEIGSNAKTTGISGTVTLKIAASGATTYEFNDVILSGTSNGGPRAVGVQGSLIGESAFTTTGMSTDVLANTLRFSLDGLPAGTEFTTFASSNLEKALMGAATYQCGPNILTIRDASAATTVVWSAT